ncbi:MAG: hypothetical protein Q9181_008019 [Wetmoreana brouardii]
MKQSIHPINRLDRRERHDTLWRHKKQKFFLAIAIAFIMLQLLFLGLMAYIYGSLWNSESRYDRFHVLFLDFDHGLVGQTLNLAYQKLKGPSFPSFISQSTTEYPSPEAAFDAVRDGSFWAAVFANPGSSDRLAAALHGGLAAQSYDPSTAITYIWNGVRYPPFSDAVFQANFQKLVSVIRAEYLGLNGTFALQTINSTDEAAVHALFNPIHLSEVNIMPTTQGPRLLYNTISMVMPLLQQFFLLLIINGISHELQLYSKIPVHLSGLARLSISIVYDLIGSLCMVGYIWAFRETWSVTGSQFVLTWMVLWLLFHIHFVVLDTVTAFVPFPGIPFLLLIWIIINITSSLSPFEVSPGFYSWGYALPAYEAYTILTDIWSSGSAPQIHRALPILFCWWIAGLGAATYGHVHRCHKAWMLERKLGESSKSRAQEAPEDNAFESGNFTALEMTPSEQLVEAVNAYRSAYGPSVPVPLYLARMFALFPKNETPAQQKAQQQRPPRRMEDQSFGEETDQDRDHEIETINGVPINRIPTAKSQGASSGGF